MAQVRDQAVSKITAYAFSFPGLSGGDLRLFGHSSELQETRLQAHLGHVTRVYANRQEAVDGGTTLVRPRGVSSRLSWRSLFGRRHRSLGWG